ncbi:MAG: 2-hydroxyacid dehydrogenase [Gammaproteobacteria bacterium]|nr:2-hydroxyacid dehydrogenase [Gammaproteobacteria bacterium]MBU1506437.1 2-hydroxyacid dehydrogenase [Gammaproteobacteria bacterium]MBU2119128.1 2-hydroxyacid dehydrogenase [Gammaproteobacteria bacterium]MBU2171902.1 2-hydroxyacid dehydrogenase [Gammaproteobacteria bacterium]MBU2201318.1 2-hydroxyacid dehydrogenase [Gammaproteobacteria bacterium]
MTTATLPRILQIGRLPLPALEAELAAQFNVSCLADQPNPAAFLAAHGAQFSGVVTTASIGLKADVIAALPQLQVISSFGVGFDALDIDAAKARGVQVGYTPGVLNDCVADLAFGLMLDVSRGIAASDRFVRRGEWRQAKFALGTRVSGKRLGIVGMGRIGQAVAERAAGFRMEVGYHNRRPAEGCALSYFESLTALAQWADYLVLTVAGGAGTRHLVNDDVLSALGPNGYLINVARGSVVDEAALIAALAERRIAGAGLDVFADEPNVPDALMALDNVVLTPHTASATHETRRAMADLVLENLQAFYATGAVRVPVPGTAALP